MTAMSVPGRTSFPPRPAIERARASTDDDHEWVRALARLASLPIEQLDRRWWADELLLALRAVLPATAGCVRLLVDGQTWVTIASFGAYWNDCPTSLPDRSVTIRERYLAAAEPLVIERTGALDPDGRPGSPQLRPTVLVGLPALVEGELLAAAELCLSDTQAMPADDPGRLNAAQWLVDVASTVLANLEAYQRERTAGELLQQLLDGDRGARATTG